MQYVPAQDHSEALIMWLVAPRLHSRTAFLECLGHVDRLRGTSVVMAGYGPESLAKHMRLLTPARADAWLREHVASEPTSLLRGVVT